MTHPPMTPSEIRAAVDSGHTVHYANRGYVVERDPTIPDRYYIHYIPTGHRIGLSWIDSSGNEILNGADTGFYIATAPTAPRYLLYTQEITFRVPLPESYPSDLTPEELYLHLLDLDGGAAFDAERMDDIGPARDFRKEPH